MSDAPCADVIGRFAAAVVLAGLLPLALGAQEPVRSDVILIEDCSRALLVQDGSREAIQTCRDAVAAADTAGEAENRHAARGFLGDVLMFAQAWPEAVAAYESALGISLPSDVSDLRAGQILTRLALAQANAGNVEAADRNAETAAAKLQASMKAHPAELFEHAAALSTTYRLHARIKQALGDSLAADVLERKAGALAGGR